MLPTTLQHTNYDQSAGIVILISYFIVAHEVTHVFALGLNFNCQENSRVNGLYHIGYWTSLTSVLAVQILQQNLKKLSGTHYFSLLCPYFN